MVTLISPLVPPSLATSAVIVTSSPPVGESSSKLISFIDKSGSFSSANAVSYTHLRAHETP